MRETLESLRLEDARGKILGLILAIRRLAYRQRKGK